MPDQATVSAFISLIRDLSGPGALLFLVIKAWLDHRKSQDVVTERLTEGEVEDRAHTAQLTTSLVNVLDKKVAGDADQTKQIALLVAELRASNVEDKVAHNLEAERLEQSAHQTESDRQLIREQTSAVAINTETILDVAKKLANDIEKAKNDSAEVLGKKLDKMGEELSSKLEEQLTALPQILSDLQKSMVNLSETINEKLATVPEQFKDVAQTVKEFERVVNKTVDAMVVASTEMQKVHGEINAINSRLDALAQTPPKTIADQAPLSPPDSPAGAELTKP